jgi:hypothetical protein
MVPLETWWKQSSLLAEAQGLCGKAFFKRRGLLETASQLHDAAPFLRGRRERVMAFSSPIVAEGHAVIGFVNTYGRPKLSNLDHRAHTAN